MKLKSLIIENFRCYKEKTRIEFDDLTAFIGANDIGKSTILEALEIFFNNDIVKIDKQDLCVFGENKEIIIGCIFQDLPEQIILDSTATTSLNNEYLLNTQGFLEIYKKYNCENKTISPQISIIANHPSEENTKDLLNLTNAQLKQKFRTLNINNDNVNNNSNVELRAAIRNYIGELNLETTEIKIEKTEKTQFWKAIQKELPIYALFQSDRPCQDKDAEIQDPMKIAIKAAVNAVKEDLNEIEHKIQEHALEVANRTLEKLNEMNSNLASELTPKFKEEPKWDSIFKLGLTSDDSIPINKRGSGIRRLILLNFFRAEADRKREQESSPNIIYAIEEPETSQHPNHQKIIIQSLLELSHEGNSQVVLTTHVPGLAGLIPVENLRYIEKTEDSLRIRYKNNDLYLKIAEELGLLPDLTQTIKLIICVEGPNDVIFLQNISEILYENDNTIINLKEDKRVIIIPLGGSTLKYWVQKHYMKDLKIPELHIYDGDKPEYISVQKEVNERDDNSICFITNKLEMENYIHSDAIDEIYDFSSNDTSITLGDRIDVPKYIAKTVYEMNTDNNWDELKEKDQEKKISRVKKRLNKEATTKMTIERLADIDSNGEILSWFNKMKELLPEEVRVL